MRDPIFFFFLPVLAATTLFSWLNKTEPAVDDQERVYYTRSGGVYCSRRELTPCGYKLSRCSDTMVYECVTDLKYEDLP